MRLYVGICFCFFWILPKNEIDGLYDTYLLHLVRNGQTVFHVPVPFAFSPATHKCSRCSIFC